MKFLENNTIKVEPPKRPKKLTATRFASILGFNSWSTPFKAWCEMTRTYEEPFEDNIYTIAGKTIEPKISDYLKARYFMDIKSPTDVYGPDYFKKTWGDFFHDTKALGGMWDFIGDDFVVEVKTTKRVEDWKGVDGQVEPPIYYKLQACLYAYLLGFDNVVMTCSFLTDKDYASPEKFVPTIDNTVVVEFSLAEEYPTFKESYIDPALKFWDEHVLTGISPEFDEKKDADILKELRKNVTEAKDEDIQKLMNEADKLIASIDKAEAKIKDKKDRLKEIQSQVKESMAGQFRDGDTKVEISSKKYTWTLAKSNRTSLDQSKLKKELPDVYDKYKKTSEVYTLKTASIE